MNTTTTPLRPDLSSSAAGLARMIHFEVDAAALQRYVPFELDPWEGRAFVSLVAFTLRGMRPRLGGRLAAWLLKPIATHDLLNVRTYVRQGGEPVVRQSASSVLPCLWPEDQTGPAGEAHGSTFRPGAPNCTTAGETGIHFLEEWSSSWLAVKLGPRTFGLPYRFGRISYEPDWRSGKLSGRVVDAATGLAFAYRADSEIGVPFAPCERGSFDE